MKDSSQPTKDSSKAIESTSLNKTFVSQSSSSNILVFKIFYCYYIYFNYFKKKPKELDRLVEFIKGESCNNSQLIGETSNSTEALFSINGDV